MPVDATTAGTYVQLSRGLRISRGAGQPDRLSQRPMGEDRKGRFFKDDPTTNPTLVTFEIGDQVDVASLLRIGAILPYQAPSPPRKGK